MSPLVLIISGTMGTGKTTTLYEASDILTSLGIAHAAIDLDALGVVFSPDKRFLSDELMIENLASIWENFARAGIERVLIARAVDRPSELEQLHQALGVSASVVGRLTTSLKTAEARVALRDCGMHREKFVARVAELNALLDAAALEKFTVENDGRAITEVAGEFLRCAGWLPDAIRS